MPSQYSDLLGRSVTGCSAQNVRGTTTGVASHVTALAPFSQNSTPCGGPGPATRSSCSRSRPSGSSPAASSGCGRRPSAPGQAPWNGRRRENLRPSFSVRPRSRYPSRQLPRSEECLRVTVNFPSEDTTGPRRRRSAAVCPSLRSALRPALRPVTGLPACAECRKQSAASRGVSVTRPLFVDSTPVQSFPRRLRQRRRAQGE